MEDGGAAVVGELLQNAVSRVDQEEPLPVTLGSCSLAAPRRAVQDLCARDAHGSAWISCC